MDKRQAKVTFSFLMKRIREEEQNQREKTEENKVNKFFI